MVKSYLLALKWCVRIWYKIRILLRFEGQHFFLFSLFFLKFFRYYLANGLCRQLVCFDVMGHIYPLRHMYVPWVYSTYLLRRVIAGTSSFSPSFTMSVTGCFSTPTSFVSTQVYFPPSSVVTLWMIKLYSSVSSFFLKVKVSVSVRRLMPLNHSMVGNGSPPTLYLNTADRPIFGEKKCISCF